MSKTTPLPTEVRRRVQRALRTRSFRAALRSNTGAIDLASIMVGVIVIGVIAGIIAATLFAVIPWSQNSAAKQSLDSVRTAEGVAFVMTDKYQTVDQLIALGYLQAPSGSTVAEGLAGGSGTGIRGPVFAVTAPQSTQVVLNAAGTCYVSGTRSATGDIFFSTSKDAGVDKYRAGTSTTDWCAPLEPLVIALGGPGILPPVVTAGTASGGVVGALYQYAIGTSGTTSSYRVSVGVLPAGLQLDAASGVISGTPTAAGTSQFSVAAANPAGESAAVSFTINVVKLVSGTAVGAGSNTAFAIDSDGYIWGWGSNASKMVGTGSAAAAYVLTQTRLAPPANPLQKFKQVAAGDYYAVALDVDGHLWSWGSDSVGQLGNSTAGSTTAPAMIAPSQTFSQITAGWSNAVAALDTSGRIWTWGDNTYGQAGNGTTSTTPTQVPTPVTPVGTVFTKIALNYLDGLALDSGGRIWAWGYNNHGQAGTGTSTPVYVPTKLATTQQFTAITSGVYASIAVASDGRLWSWGSNTYGSLGNGAGPSDVILPTKVTTSQTFTQVSTRTYTVLAIATDGRLWSWGQNSSGELGTGTAGSASPSPTKQSITTRFTGLANGYSSSYAMDDTGHLWTWGANGSGQLGTGATSGNNATPTLVTGAWGATG